MMPLKRNFYKKQPEALYCAAGCFAYMFVL